MAFNLNELLADRDFQNMLANIGTGLDPEGVGGALGRAAVGHNKSKAMQESVDKAAEEDKEFKKSLLRALGGQPMEEDAAKSLSAPVPEKETEGSKTGVNKSIASGTDVMTQLRNIAPFYLALIGQ